MSTRREFIKVGSLWVGAAALGVDLLGCRDATSGGRPATSAAPPATATASATAASAPASAAPADAPAPYGYASASPAPAAPHATCATTATNIEGPYYRAGAPMRASLVESGMKGKRLALGGRVFGEDCSTPIDGAVLDFWQADADGHYDNDGHDGRKNGPLVLRGKVSAAKDGAYSVATIIPGRYLNGPQYRPSHIHVKVSAPGYKPLTTQLYFEGDPYNAVDPFIDMSLVMKLTDRSGASAANFDFVLRRA